MKISVLFYSTITSLVFLLRDFLWQEKRWNQVYILLMVRPLLLVIDVKSMIEPQSFDLNRQLSKHVPVNAISMVCLDSASILSKSSSGFVIWSKGIHLLSKARIMLSILIGEIPRENNIHVLKLVQHLFIA